jgi:predicted component of viral defense system (DUF524 family)
MTHFCPSQLRPGDEVAVKILSKPPYFTIHHVREVTPDGIIVLTNDQQYDRDGKQIGPILFFSSRLVETTPAIRHAYHRYVLLETIHAFSDRWKSMSTETLEEVAEMLTGKRWEPEE